jgi:hypothetical protein
MRNSMKTAGIALGITLALVLMAIMAFRPQSTPVLQDPAHVSATDNAAPADDSTDDAVNGQPIVNNHVTGRVGTVRHSVGAHAGPTQPPASNGTTTGGTSQPPTTSDSDGHQDALVPDTGNTSHDGISDGGPDNAEPDTDQTGGSGSAGGSTDNGGSTDTGGSTGSTGGSTGSTGGSSRQLPPGGLSPISGDALQRCVATNCFNR